MQDVKIAGVTYGMGHDARGRLTDVIDKTLHYDGMSRITHVNDATDTTLLVGYLYDGDGRLVYRDDGGGQVFSYIGENMVAAFDDNGAVSWATEPLRQPADPHASYARLPTRGE